MVQIQLNRVSSGVLCNFVAVCLTSVQFILQLRLCLYTVLHLLVEELKISLKSPLSTQSVPYVAQSVLESRVGVWIPKFSNPRVGVPRKKARTPHSWFKALKPTLDLIKHIL